MKKILLPLIAFLSGAMPLLAQPVITRSPTNQVLATGTTLTLSVTANDPRAAYRWFKDSRLLLGATNSTLTVTNAGVTNSGSYYVVVTNRSGMIISRPALVSVGNPCLLAWGVNWTGQLGNGNYNNTNRPIIVASNVVAGAAGDSHSLFVTPDGTLWGMGQAYYGQLGGITRNTCWPTNVASNVVAVAAGFEYSLFVTTNGTLWAMGRNAYGQLGDGTTNNASAPVSVASNVVAVAAGRYHSLFVKNDGTLWTMGCNIFGQLGNGNYNNTNRPSKVASNVVAVAAGSYHSLFIKNNGTFWAMGDNTFGELGIGIHFFVNGNNTNRPMVVASNVVAVAAGADHSLFITADGKLWAMGWNGVGQLGNGDNTDSNVLSPECVASNVVAAVAGAGQSLFVTSDSTLWTTGGNYYGELGNGSNSDTNRPVCVLVRCVADVFPVDQALNSLAIGFLYAPAVVALGNLNQIYTGNAVSVKATTAPSGLKVNVTYNGSPTAPTNAGSYTVIGTISDPNYFGSATNTLIVGVPPHNFTGSSTNSANGRQLTFRLTGTPYYSYVLTMATNLEPPIVWQPILTNPADVNGNWSWTLTNLPLLPAGFYRAAGR